MYLQHLNTSHNNIILGTYSYIMYNEFKNECPKRI